MTLRHRRRVLVTGCGRSGTTYISNALKQIGLDVGHECMGAHGSASWYFAAPNSNYLPPAYASMPRKHHGDGSRVEDFDFDVVLHQVRHPLKVIGSSMKVMTEKDWAFIAYHAGFHPKLPRLKRAMFYWLRWNGKLVPNLKPVYRYRIESIDEAWPDICRLLDVKPVPVPQVSRKMNASTGRMKAKEVRWQDLRNCDALLAKRVQALAEEFGYAN